MKSILVIVFFVLLGALSAFSQAGLPKVSFAGVGLGEFEKIESEVLKNSPSLATSNDLEITGFTMEVENITGVLSYKSSDEKITDQMTDAIEGCTSGFRLTIDNIKAKDALGITYDLGSIRIEVK
jgi:hypothetical protein